VENEIHRIHHWCVKNCRALKAEIPHPCSLLWSHIWIFNIHTIREPPLLFLWIFNYKSGYIYKDPSLPQLAGGIMSMMMEQMTRVAVQRSMEEQTPTVPPASERVRDALPRVVVTKDWITETDHIGVMMGSTDCLKLEARASILFRKSFRTNIWQVLENCSCHVPTIKYSHAIHAKNLWFWEKCEEDLLDSTNSKCSVCLEDFQPGSRATRPHRHDSMLKVGLTIYRCCVVRFLESSPFFARILYCICILRKPVRGPGAIKPHNDTLATPQADSLLRPSHPIASR